MTRRAVVLAGGRGSRLAPYTTVLPKPLMPVGDRAILEIVLRQLSDAGFDDVTLAVGHLGHLIRAVLGDGRANGTSIRYHEEEQPLGTAGPLATIPTSARFLMLNGDVLTTLDFRAFVAAHEQAGNQLTIATHRRVVRADYGVLRTDGARGLTDRVMEYEEKPELTYTVSMGVYVVERAAVDHVPPRQSTTCRPGPRPSRWRAPGGSYRTTATGSTSGARTTTGARSPTRPSCFPSCWEVPLDDPAADARAGQPPAHGVPRAGDGRARVRRHRRGPQVPADPALVRAAPAGVPTTLAPAALRRDPRGALAHVRWIRRLCHDIRPAVVHAHWLCGYAAFAAIARATPLVAMAWGSDVFGADGVRTLANRVALRGADVAMADSQALVDRLIALGAARDSTVLVNWGVDLATFAPVNGAQPAVRAELDLGPGPVILSPRSLTPLYNTETILAAFALVTRAHPETQLVLKHMGIDHPALPGVADARVHIVGHVPHERMARYYQAADVCVSIPSSDSSPRSVWEAMACGCPVVVSDLPWVHELIAAERDAHPSHRGPRCRRRRDAPRSRGASSAPLSPNAVTTLPAIATAPARPGTKPGGGGCQHRVSGRLSVSPCSTTSVATRIDGLRCCRIHFSTSRSTNARSVSTVTRPRDLPALQSSPSSTARVKMPFPVPSNVVPAASSTACPRTRPMRVFRHASASRRGPRPSVRRSRQASTNTSERSAFESPATSKSLAAEIALDRSWNVDSAPRR